MLDGSFRLADRAVPRAVDLPWAVFGLSGVGVGLYGLGEARWYAHQMTAAYPTAFYAGASYGPWLVCYGGLAILVIAAVTCRHLRRLGSRITAASLLSVVVIAGSLTLAPRR